MTYLRFATAGIGLVAATAYGLAIALLRRDRSRVAHDYARLLARLTQRPLGIRLRVHGERNLYRERPCVFVANHQSNFDIPVLASVFPTETVVVAKKELRRVPLFGWLVEATGNVYIDRRDREQAVGSLKAAEQEVRRRRVSVWIFPEGTRGRVPGELLPFKKGAFQLAIGAGVPVVPVVVAPLKRVIDVTARRIRPGWLDVRVLEPVATVGLAEADVDSLVATVHDRMQDALSAMAAPPGGTVPPESPGGGQPPGRGRLSAPG